MPFNGERTFEVMQKHNIDALIATSTENVYYLSDYWCLGKKLGCGIDAYTVLPIKGDPSIVAPLKEADLILNSNTWINDLRFYGKSGVDIIDSEEISELTKNLIQLYKEAKTNPDGLNALIKIIEENKLSNSSIGLDTTGLSPSQYDYIQSRLPNATIVDGSSILSEIRLVKTKPELERIVRATEITEKSMEDALEIARSEITELDLAGMFAYSAAYDGGQVTQNMIGIGERSAYPNPVPSAYEAKRRDMVRFTFGCSWEHYHSNISRTAVIGRPLARDQRRYETVQKAQETAFEVISPGVKVSEVYAAVMKELEASNVTGFDLPIGHGIGVECNEVPNLTQDNELELEAGMILNIDIPLLEVGTTGAQIEDTIIITDDGCGLLSKTERTLYLL